MSLASVYLDPFWVQFSVYIVPKRFVDIGRVSLTLLFIPKNVKGEEPAQTDAIET